MSHIRTEFFILLALLAAVASATAADLLSNRGFSASVGGEYQLISQEYYRVVTDTVTVDLIETWQFSRDDINDYIFRTDLGYRYRNERNRFDFLTDLEVSGERFLGRADAAYRLGSDDHSAKIAVTFESKAPYGDTDDRQEGYNHLVGYLRMDHMLGAKFGLNAKVGYDWVGFSEAVESSGVGDTDFVSNNIFPYYDYGILTAGAGAVFLFSEFGNDLNWQAIYRNRRVPDSSEADYDSYRLELNYSTIGLRSYASVTGYVEMKEYALADNEDDYKTLELTGMASRSLGERWEGAGYFLIDAYWYDRTDVVHRDYRLLRGEIKSSYRLDGIGMGPLLRLELRREDDYSESVLDYFSDTYTQWEFGAHADMLEIHRLYFTAELTAGYRSYGNEAATLTSYRLFSPSLVATYSLNDRLSVNVLFDGVFERHDQVEDNTTLYLLTIGVNARF